MDKKLFLQRFRKQLWAPTTPSGNPLFKRTAENNDEEMLQIVEKDPDYATKVEKTWSSPSHRELPVQRSGQYGQSRKWS